MISSELDAAGVHDPALRDAYRRCRTLNAEHGRTFFLATRLLAPHQRPAVHALYGFARRADDILDDFDSVLTTDETGRPAAAARDPTVQSAGAKRRKRRRSGAGRGRPHRAASTTSRGQLFDDFLGSMRMDLTVTDYPDRGALDRYMYGSAEVIGLQLLPVLGTICPREEAAPYAAALGKAFQLTNFLRDVDEDLERGRVYLPADELAAHRRRPRCVDVVPQQPAHRRAGTPCARRAARRNPAHLRVCEDGYLTACATITALRGSRIDAVLGNTGLHRGASTSPFSASAPPSAPAADFGSPANGLAKAWAARLRALRTVSDGRWQYLSSWRRAWRSRLRWRSSAPASTGRRAVPLVLCCRSRPCSSCGTRWRSPRTSGPTTRVTSPASNCRALMPIEEVLFFIVIPLCGLLTYNAVDTILTRLRRPRNRAARTP